MSLYRGNSLTANDILELGNTHVVIATGARWTRLLYSPLEVPAGELAGAPESGAGIFTPDDIAAGAQLDEPIVVFDYDSYYMGSALAEHLARGGERVSYVTPAGHASTWAIMSNEQPQVHRALAGAGISLHTHARVTGLAGGEVTLANLFTGAEARLPCAALVIVGARLANDQLYTELAARPQHLEAAGIRSLTRIGDALAPGALVHAVYSGHRYARELDGDHAARSWRRDAPLSRSAESSVRERGIDP